MTAIPKFKIFLMTSSYPFTFSAEAPFLAEEVRKLGEKFEIVFVPSLVEGELNPELPIDSSIDVSLAEKLRVMFDGSKSDKTRRILGLMFRPGFVTLPLLLTVFRNLSFLMSPGFMRKVLSSALSDYEGRQWVKRNKLHSEYPKSLIYSYWLTPESLGVASAAAIPVISRAHATDLYEDRQSPPFFPLRRERVGNLSGVFPCSQHGTEHLLSSYPFLGDRVTTKYLATPDMGFPKFPLSGVSKSYIISCSFLVQVKQVELIAQAVSSISSRLEGQNIDWIHFGDGPLRPELQALARNIRGVKATVEPVPGRAGLRDFYDSRRVLAFVNASKSEGLPVSLMEAASFGIPLIGPDVGGVSELIHDGVNGYLLKSPTSSDDISKALLSLLTLTPSQHEQFRTKSREFWGMNHDSRSAYASFSQELLALAEAKPKKMGRE